MIQSSPRREFFGMILNPRTCEWQSGTSLAFGVNFRDNTHTAPNYRVPLQAGTHSDGVCRSNKCKVMLSVKTTEDENSNETDTNGTKPREQSSALFEK